MKNSDVSETIYAIIDGIAGVKGYYYCLGLADMAFALHEISFSEREEMRKQAEQKRDLDSLQKIPSLFDE